MNRIITTYWRTCSSINCFLLLIVLSWNHFSPYSRVYSQIFLIEDWHLIESCSALPLDNSISFFYNRNLLIKDYDTGSYLGCSSSTQNCCLINYGEMPHSLCGASGSCLSCPNLKNPPELPCSLSDPVASWSQIRLKRVGDGWLNYTGTCSSLSGRDPYRRAPVSDLKSNLSFLSKPIKAFDRNGRPLKDFSIYLSYWCDREICSNSFASNWRSYKIEVFACDWESP